MTIRVSPLSLKPPYRIIVGNNPVNLLDPWGLNGEIWPYFRDTQHPKPAERRLPDYISLNVNVAIPTPWTGTLIGWSGQASLDRYGNLYWAPLGATVGKSATGISGSLTAGWLNEVGKPCEERLKDFLSGHSLNFGGGFWAGGGLTWVPGRGTATEVGFVTPQAGVSYHYSWQKVKLPFSW